MNEKIILLIIMAFFLISTVFAQQELPIGLQRLRDYQRQLAGSITLFIAFFAGLISFTSPCGIAFLPAFFSLAFKDRKKTMLMASAFAAGLIIAFAIFGLIAGLFGDFFNLYKLAFAVVSGWILVLFAIFLFFNVSFGILNFKIDYSNKNSLLSMMLLGFFFGVGFTPCAGPILLGILVLSANATTLLSGVLMLIFYGIGIATPLIILAYFSDRYDWANSKILRGKLIEFSLFGKKITTHSYNIIGSSLLMAIGILMIIYKGTFFFQTDLPRILPWTMSFWAQMNENAIESRFLTSFYGNILGLIVSVALALFLLFQFKKSGGGKK